MKSRFNRFAHGPCRGPVSAIIFVALVCCIYYVIPDLIFHGLLWGIDALFGVEIEPTILAHVLGALVSLLLVVLVLWRVSGAQEQERIESERMAMADRALEDAPIPMAR